MTEMFHKLLLSELHMVTYQPGNPADITDDLICESVTLNENLRSFGYVLRPDDIIRLAVSKSLHGFFNDFRKLIPDVKADPMYPGFPQQVMEMSEAEFRLHQGIHYFTTYGMESLLGREVSSGWLPDDNGPERYQADTELLVETVLRFLGALDFPAGDVNLVPVRSERLTSPRILDLCTGTGCVGISVLNSLLAKGIRAQAVLADISDEALAIARENIESQAADKSAVKAIKLDVLSEDLPEDLGSFDVITANPPYINSVDMKALDKEVKDHEPHLALAGGEDGLDFYLPICKLSHKCLRQGGMLAVEHGYDQAEGVSQTLMAQGFNIVKSLKDFGNNDRVTFGIK